MSSPPPLIAGLADWLTLIIEGLRVALGARAEKERSVAPLMLLAWARLGELSARFARLVAAVQKGRRPAARGWGSGGERPARDEDHDRWPFGPGDPPIPERLPAKFGWLVEAAPEAAVFADQVQEWLEEPELTALLAEAPQAERVLRPLLRMLGIKPGPALVAAREEQEAARAAAKSAPPDWEAFTGLPPPDWPFWSSEHLMSLLGAASDDPEADPVFTMLEPGFFEPG